MNPYIFPSYCDVCGEEAVTDYNGMVDGFFSYMVHKDPSICAANIAWKREQEIKKQKNKDNVEYVI